MPIFIITQYIIEKQFYYNIHCFIFKRLMKPHLTDDQRGPWEIVWNKFIDVFGEDRYKHYVWGKKDLSYQILMILLKISSLSKLCNW